MKGLTLKILIPLKAPRTYSTKVHDILTPFRTKGSTLTTPPVTLYREKPNLNLNLATKPRETNTKHRYQPAYIRRPIRCSNPSTFSSVHKSSRHVISCKVSELMRAGIEPNPGPEDAGDTGPDAPDVPQQQRHQAQRTGLPNLPLSLTTYNVRGLNDESKLRHLLNFFHKSDKGKSLDNVICLQETYIDNPGKIPYIWRGNFFLTPGAGNSCGCLTLLSPHLNVIANVNLDNRAHVLACQRNGETNVSLIIANVYAPNPNTREKYDFFDKVFEAVREMEDSYNCHNTFVAGDFNLIFNGREAKNRNFAPQEQRLAKSVKALVEEAELKDIWLKREGFTWRRSNSDVFSTIDRIFYSAEQYKLVKLKTNWSLSYSDHAALETYFSNSGRANPPKSRITRLDPHLAKDIWTREKVIEGYDEMIGTMPNDWDPHKKLEFAKLCIRTVCENVQAERKRNEISEEDSINEELEMAIEKLARDGTVNKGLIIDYIEELRNKKQLLINAKGERLADKLGTKWYNEGEKSTRYFMRLLNRSMPDQFNKIQKDNGEVVSDPEAIEEEIVLFYKNLYESYTPTILDPDSDVDFFDKLIPISGPEADRIAKEITLSELASTIETCKDSAPGPDGIPYSLIRLFWYSFGKILCESWNYSLMVKRLPPSHKTSYLRLIPKAGKDLSKLTNWRPITLSNCDHKLITKIYAKRMCENVAKSISERQTAYLKGRLINDNIRSIISTINVTNFENVAAGLIVSLDAKKAFDSVEHSYIKLVLGKFGCSSFVPIFETLYSELETNILVNGKISKSYKILRGVKQGDSLSCILFIMCMEPLLRNIDNNVNIGSIDSLTLGAELPKVYAYADDVNGTIKDTELSLENVFLEYERLSKLSGLELNADKTEVMRLGRDPAPKAYKVKYLDKEFEVNTCEQIKINGILFQRNQEEMINANVEVARSRIDANFAKWSRRSLSTLGKILIAKTFGISQIIFLLQSLVLKNAHIKVLNAILYKFIWNKHYHAAKAPERIKRIIATTPIKLGGLGMLDISVLDEGLKVRALGRLLETNHPLLSLVKAGIDLSDFFNPKCSYNVDPVISQAVASLKKYRNNLWKDASLASNKSFLLEISNSKISDLISANGRVSISYFLIHNRGKRKLRDLTVGELNNLERYIEGYKLPLVKTARRLNDNTSAGVNQSILIGGKFKSLTACSSRSIRLTLSKPQLITDYKIGLMLSKSEALNWADRVSKLSSVRHKNLILRIAHGDIYTNDKLLRFGLGESNKCDRCDEIETLQHKFIDCSYVKEIWKHLFRLTNTIVSSDQQNLDPIKACLGAAVDASVTVTTINAEILQRILSLTRSQNYLLHPKKLIELALKLLSKREKSVTIKTEVGSLLRLIT